MMKLGLIGWRGMVGSVLRKRMRDEKDLEKVSPFYFSTSAVNGTYCDDDGIEHVLRDAYSIEQLSEMDIIITCQGGGYTNDVYQMLRDTGWDGYWIDAASAKRMDKDSIIVLDPVNLQQIEDGIESGVRNFIGGNCSITLSLIGLSGLFKSGLLEWASLMTYQAASGAGAAQVRELLSQMQAISKNVEIDLATAEASVLTIIEKANGAYSQDDFPMSALGAPLAGSLIPWIDSDLGNGVSREEWKGEVETNKILGLAPGTIKVDGLCIRVPVLQSHSAAITFKLKEKVDFSKIEKLIQHGNEWVNYIPNKKEDSIEKLSPAAVSGSLKVSVGRLRLLNIDTNTYSVLTIGDQLLWGAAEPLRRVLNIIIEKISN